MMTDEPEKRSSIPRWGWLLATIFFPVGYFAILGKERLISKRLAWGLGLLTYGVLIIFAAGMKRMTEGSLQHQMLSSLVAIFMFGVGFWQYQIGKLADYWSLTARRRWRIVGVFAIILIVLNLVAVAAVLLNPATTK